MATGSAPKFRTHTHTHTEKKELARKEARAAAGGELGCRVRGEKPTRQGQETRKKLAI